MVENVSKKEEGIDRSGFRSRRTYGVADADKDVGDAGDQGHTRHFGVEVNSLLLPVARTV
jgi:hypothetical protein